MVLKPSLECFLQFTAKIVRIDHIASISIHKIFLKTILLDKEYSVIFRVLSPYKIFYPLSVDKSGGKYVTGRQSRPLSWKSQDNTQCMWTLTAPEGSSIFLNFIKFKMFGSGWSSSCTVEDAVEIYDTKARTLIARYCRSSLPPKLYIAHHSKITIVARALSDSTTMDLLLLHSATSLKYV